jgi:hypothetical protein
MYLEIEFLDDKNQGGNKFEFLLDFILIYSQGYLD